MASNFPTALDSLLTNQPYVDGSTVIAAAALNNIQDAVDKLQTKVGKDSSAVTTSIDYKLTNKVQVYNSGWFAVAQNTAYSKSHGLGVMPDLVQVWYSETSDGSGDVTLVGNAMWDASACAMVSDITATAVTVWCPTYIADYKDSSGTRRQRTSGYLRMVAVKFN